MEGRRGNGKNVRERAGATAPPNFQLGPRPWLAGDFYQISHEITHLDAQGFVSMINGVPNLELVKTISAALSS